MFYVSCDVSYGIKDVPQKNRCTFSHSFYFRTFFAAPTIVKAATLTISPGSGTFVVGSTFDASIILDTKDKAANAIEVELLFPADKVQLANPSVGKSIVQLWPAPPEFSNRDGRIYFAGGIPSPGINVSNGVVLTLTFRVVAPGDGEIAFGPKTHIFANDGKGTNILKQKSSGFFHFTYPPPEGPTISSPTHPDPDIWYRNNNPIFIWPKDTLSDGYSYEINKDPEGYPATVINGTNSSVSYRNVSNGTWYFHLREKAEGVWGGVSHYMIKVDVLSPASFSIDVSPGVRTTSRSPIVRLFTTDAFSGLDHYELKIVSLSSPTASDALFFETGPTYQLTDLQPGRYEIIARAVDKAKNYEEAAVTLSVVGAFNRFISQDGIDLVFVFLPWSWIIMVTSFILVILLLILLSIWLRHRHHLKEALYDDLKWLMGFFKKSNVFDIHNFKK